MTLFVFCFQHRLPLIERKSQSEQNTACVALQGLRRPVQLLSQKPGLVLAINELTSYVSHGLHESGGGGKFEVAA